MSATVSVHPVETVTGVEAPIVVVPEDDDSVVVDVDERDVEVVA